MSKSKIFATLGIFVLIFFLSWLYYGKLMPDFYESHMGTAKEFSKMPPDMLLLTLGLLISAYMLVTLYSKWARGAHGTSQGA